MVIIGVVELTRSWRRIRSPGIHDPWLMTSRWSTCSTASRPGGVVIAGDLTISLAVVDLVHISLRALISPAEKLMQQRPSAGRIEWTPTLSAAIWASLMLTIVELLGTADGAALRPVGGRRSF